MLEEGVKALIKKWIGKRLHIKLFTNARGLGYVQRSDGTYQARMFGLGMNGCADQIGWREVVVTQDMVGRKIAQFVGFEVKKDD